MRIKIIFLDILNISISYQSSFAFSCDCWLSLSWSSIFCLNEMHW